MKAQNKVCVIGVGMTKFHKPGQMDYPELSKDAGEQALKDAGISYDEIEQAFVGYVYGDSTCGQRAVYQLGLTGHPRLQRQQQLLDRLDRALPRLAGDRERHERLRARARLREDGARLARPPSSRTARIPWTSTCR